MSELRVERKENMAGGKGHVIIKHILEDKELNGKCKMYAEVTLEPGCSLGYHEHHNESETYYILRGEGNYDDNGRIRPVKAGDMTFTPDGMGHGLTNTGDTDLVNLKSASGNDFVIDFIVGCTFCKGNIVF